MLDKISEPNIDIGSILDQEAIDPSQIQISDK